MWPNSPETQKLLDEARDNQPGAVDKLLTAHREPLRRMIAVRLDPALARRIDASDVAQDAMLEASRRLQDYLRNPAMPFKLWLRLIAQDHIKDAHRRHRQAQRRSLDREQPLVPAGLTEQSSLDLAARFIDHELTPATAALRQEMEKNLQRAIAQMDDDDREILLMRHFDQLSNQEVAQALGLSEPAASMRCLRAQRKLRTILLPDSGDSAEAGS
jgi:RNA polymerase sigma-70 factor (ECF subfamily)